MTKKVVFCNCGGKLIGDERLVDISAYLKQMDHPFDEISDLCGCAVEKKEEIRLLYSSVDQIMIIACYPRAVKRLFEFCGIDNPRSNLSYLNIRELSNNQIFNSIDDFFSGESANVISREVKSSCEWPSWYPIIDYSRCNSCGQCADFCLFGVYEKIDNKVVVINPTRCKNNCPACARICPQITIIFPKYGPMGAIAGSGSIDEIAEQQRQNQDIDSILGSNIYKALEMRKAKRQSIIRATAMQKAIEERENALAERDKNQ